MNLNWSNTVIKYVLFVFNLLFVISGIVMIAVGVSVKGYFDEYDIFLGNQYFSLPNLLIAIGSLIFFISFFGCCGAVKESWFMIFIFSVLLALIFILEFSAGIAGYVLRDQTYSYLSDSLTDKIKDYKVNKTDDANTKMWDTIQTEFSCCGAKNASDWSTMEFAKDGNLPSSCCKANTGSVGPIVCNLKDNSTATFYDIGCVDGFGDFLKSHAVTLGGVGIAIGFIQLFAVIFACHLAKQIKNGFVST